MPSIMWLNILLLNTLYHLSGAEEYCFTETFQPRCNANAVIVITSALFGRLDVGRCITNHESLGCYYDVISYLDYSCSGRRACTLPVMQLELTSNASCLKDYKNYLEVEYTCEIVNADYCPANESRLLQVASDAVVMPTDVAGTELCPWNITALPGQRIHLDLLDITLTTTLSEMYTSRLSDGECPVSVVTADGTGHTEVVYLCNVNTRQQNIYTSPDNVLQFYVNVSKNFTRQPVYIFSFMVEGCPTLIPPANTWMTSDGLGAEIHCNSTGDTWYLVCKDNIWYGKLGNCSEDNYQRNSETASGNYSYAVLISVGIGLTSGIVVGLTLLGIVIGVRKCRRYRSRNKHRKVPDLSTIDIPTLTKTRDRVSRFDIVKCYPETHTNPKAARDTGHRPPVTHQANVRDIQRSRWCNVNPGSLQMIGVNPGNDRSDPSGTWALTPEKNQKLANQFGSRGNHYDTRDKGSCCQMEMHLRQEGTSKNTSMYDRNLRY